LVILILIVHVLASAALFGAMFYSIAVVQPRAKRFFERPAEFEEFVAFVSNGARWKVLGGYAVIAASGFALMGLGHRERSGVWVVLIVAKIVVLVAAVILFSIVSWRWWPARVFATAEEVPKFQKLFRRVGFAMIAFVGIEFVLGIVAHVM
jgi:uncharacterized membrane protein